MKLNRSSATTAPWAAAVVLASALLSALLHGQAWAGPAETKVFLNGTPVPVYFNDGDSFRVLSGQWKEARARIAGFNTLENHGPVHSWGGWHPREMYNLAKMATLHARRGVWTCTTDGKLDTYGRMLVHCHDLGVELIRLGLAHALTVTDEPADARYLAAQEQAKQHRRGIWAHGIPAFVLTSLHSSEEDVDGRGTYNRLVSTADGHSVMWRHDSHYDECQNVCALVYEVDESKVAETVAVLQKDSSAVALIAGLSEDALLGLVRDYAAYRHVSRACPRERRGALKAILDRYASQGRLGQGAGKPASCMIHVPFKRRYGSSKAGCLK